MGGDAPQDANGNGGCLCGALRYAADLSRVLTVYCCHCRDCQRLASSAFAMSMVLPAAAFSVTRGAPKTALRTADSGRRVAGAFCADCGTRLFDRFVDLDTVVVVKAGTLDETAGLRPVAQLWTARKQDWVVLPDDQRLDPHQPADFGELIVLYQASADQARADQDRGADDANG